MFLLNRVVFDSKNLRFMKRQETSASLNNLGLKTSSSKIPLLGDILVQGYKMKQIVNQFFVSRKVY